MFYPPSVTRSPPTWASRILFDIFTIIVEMYIFVYLSLNNVRRIYAELINGFDLPVHILNMKAKHNIPQQCVKRKINSDLMIYRYDTPCRNFQVFTIAPAVFSGIFSSHHRKSILRTLLDQINQSKYLKT